MIECPDMPDNEQEQFGVRIGWSNLRSGRQELQLGRKIKILLFLNNFTFR